MGTSSGSIKTRENSITSIKSIPPCCILKIVKNLCTILIKNKENINYGTGFFLKLSDSSKCLITNYHTINPDLLNDDIEIVISDKKTIKLNFINHKINYFKPPIDVTIIEIKEKDDIFKDLEFIDNDVIYINKENNIEKYTQIFVVKKSLKNELECRFGKITNINNFEFYHDCSTSQGSSGSPILLFNNDLDLSNTLRIIGIHKGEEAHRKFNTGTFIGELINEIKKDSNFILSLIFINDEDINRDIRIINSYEEYMRNYPNQKMQSNLKNEEEIKKCEIKINGEIIPFKYFVKFPKKGKYIIKYTFKNNLTKTNYMFSKCTSLININLSNLNTNTVSNMSYMFYQCKELININLTNYNTQKVSDMSGMFSGCKLLRDINLSNFQTKNVTNMSYMFACCKSLKNIRLSNFNTQHVTNMSGMFYRCESLTDIDLTNFDSQKCSYMILMFYGCCSLKKENVRIANSKILQEFKGV